MAAPNLHLPDGIVGFDSEISAFTREVGFSKREIEIFRLLLSGAVTADQAAQVLGLSPHTVNNHLKSMLEKAKVPNKTELVSLFVRQLLRRISDLQYFTRKPRVLVVDDLPEVAESVALMLIDRGIEATYCVNGDEALRLLPEKAYDFVISDIDMPVMNGIELLKKIRAYHREVPMVILMTGKSEFDLGISLDEGAVAFLPKPFNHDQIFFAIMEHFVEGKHERSRLVRVPTKLNATINQTYRFAISEIGFGGLFVPFGLNRHVTDRRFKIGAILKFTFQLEEEAPLLSAQGEVVWRRDKDELDLPAGMGIKFINLSPEVKLEVENYVRLNKIISCVPLRHRR